MVGLGSVEHIRYCVDKIEEYNNLKDEHPHKYHSYNKFTQCATNSAMFDDKCCNYCHYGCSICASPLMYFLV